MVSPIVVGGPTGSGKSNFAIQLAERIGGEIVCADSRQVYRFMRIGTASPTDEQCRLVPHHNYNFIDPNDRYDAGRFIEDTNRAVAEITSRNKTPILVGGTGLYLRCWRYGLSDVPQKDNLVREQLNKRLEQSGLEALYEELQRLDEASASKINKNDAFRILRALEIATLTGKKASELRRSHFDQPLQEARWLLIKCEREELNTRLQKRTREMFASGLGEEAVALQKLLPENHPLLDTIGYRESLAFAAGTIDIETAIEHTFIRTRQYAKRQVSWFAKEPWWEPQFLAI